MGPEEMLALLATENIYVPELDVKQEVMDDSMEDYPPTLVWNKALYRQSWSWTTTVPCSPCRRRRYQHHRWMPPQPAQDAGPFWGPPPHHWMLPPYIDLTKDEDGEDGGA